MAWVAVDKDGSEWIYEGKPKRGRKGFGESMSVPIRLPKGTIAKLIRYDLTWGNKPVELK